MLVIDNLSNSNEFNAFFEPIFQPTTNTGCNVSINLDDNKPTTSSLINFYPLLFTKLCVRQKSLSLLALTTSFWTKLTSCLSFPASIILVALINIILCLMIGKMLLCYFCFKKSDPSCKLSTNISHMYIIKNHGRYYT